MTQEGQPRHVARLREEIGRTGPITFARFMAAALYDPEDGYYVTGDDRATREGDFLSAPEQDSLFGALLARQVVDCWERLGRPAELVVRDVGAGSGALGEALLAALRAAEPEAFAAAAYEPIEVVPRREAAIRDRLLAAGLGERLRPTTPASSPVRPALELNPGLVIANEFLDALPVHRVMLSGGRLLELRVGWHDGRFVERSEEPSSPRLAETLERAGVHLVEGQRTEVGLAAIDWLGELATDLDCGYAFLIDYGHPSPERHAPDRPGGLLRTYRGHHAGDDPFAAVGTQDLTAHVDWTAIETAAAAGGLRILGRTTLAAFTVGLDAGSLLTALGAQPDMTLDRYRQARAALRDLLDPRRLGGFGVLVLGRGVPEGPPLRGLAGAVPARPAPLSR